jgi:hypothetical protein
MRLGHSKEENLLGLRWARELDVVMKQPIKLFHHNSRMGE